MDESPPPRRRPASQISLKGRALRHLARREHSRAELERKLLPYADDRPDASASEQVRAAIDALAAHGLQSDTRVAESLLAGAGQRVGPRRLAQLLHAKGIERELADDALARARGDEFEHAWALWLRRYGQPPADAAERARQMRFLAGRGFGGEVIGRVMRQAGQQAPQGPDA